jgi:hypothetical protein
MSDRIERWVDSRMGGTGQVRRDEWLTVFIAHRFTYGYAGLLVRVLQDHDLGELNAQPALSHVSTDSRKRVVENETNRSATALASWGWLLPVSNLIELVAIADCIVVEDLTEVCPWWKES